MSLRKSVLNNGLKGTIYSLIVLLIDLIPIFLLLHAPTQMVYYLSLLLLLEGGFGLVAGSAIVFYSPVASKVSESIFHSEPWTAKRQKETEKTSQVWIATGLMLVITGLLVSLV